MTRRTPNDKKAPITGITGQDGSCLVGLLPEKGYPGSPQADRTPFNPRSPYAVAKVFARFMAVGYRAAYRLHVSNGILFDLEQDLCAGRIDPAACSAASARRAGPA